MNGERRSSCKSFPLPCGVSVQEMAASFFLIRLDLGGSPAGYSDDCFADSPKLKVLCMMRLAGGAGVRFPREVLLT